MKNIYRGKIIDSNRWVTGYYSEYKEGAFISNRECDNNFRVKVKPETVGQCTGLKDKNGTRIYEGDILKNGEGYVFSGTYKNPVTFEDGQFIAAGDCVMFLAKEFQFCEVIGNIHDNPELLKGSEAVK